MSRNGKFAAVLLCALSACKVEVAKQASTGADPAKRAAPSGAGVSSEGFLSGSSPAGPISSASSVKTRGLVLLETGHLGQPYQESSIFTQRADGSGRQVITGPGNIQPSWTPDGRIIFVSYEGTSPQVVTMNATGGDRKQIGELQIPDITQPQMARNGLVVFAGDGGIWKMNQDGTGLRLLVADSGAAHASLALSGTWITYTQETNDPYHREIWRINTDGTGKKQLTFPGDPDYPDGNASMISPDESMIAIFTGKESDQGAAGFTQSVLTFGHRNVGIMSPDGGKIRLLTHCSPVTTQAEFDALGADDCIVADDPTWSPDSQWVIYARGNKTGGNVWMVDIHGEQNQKLSIDSRGFGRMIMKYTDDATTPAPGPTPVAPNPPQPSITVTGNFRGAGPEVAVVVPGQGVFLGSAEHGLTKIHEVAPALMVAGNFLGAFAGNNNNTDLAAYFPGNGTFIWSVSTGWQKIDGGAPAYIAAGNFLDPSRAALAAYFPGSGIYLWSLDRGWVKVQ